MRVLWFTNTPPAEANGKLKYNGGGWVSSLKDLMSMRTSLGIAFVSKSQGEVSVIGGVEYYPVFNPYEKSRSGRVRKLLGGSALENAYIMDAFAKVIDDFSPDVIEVFGSEHIYGKIAAYTDVPVVLHLQGILGECWKSFLPPGMSMLRYCMSGKGLAGKFGKFYYAESFRRRSRQEKMIFATVKNYIGRTDWDRGCVMKSNPDAAYFPLEEVMRPQFYANAGKWKGLDPDNPLIVTTISEAPFKGMDLVLRTADVLVRKYGRKFRWVVYGNTDAGFFEKFTGIKAVDVNVTPAGVIDADRLAEALVNASVYVHPSYIENSPNSLCEAQMIGVPSVAADVGGIPTIIDNSKTGILAERGDAGSFAAAIVSLLDSEELSRKISAASVKKSLMRNNPGAIADRLMEIYRIVKAGKLA